MKLAYICEFCGMTASEEVIREHEIDCDYNPENQTCRTCKNAIFCGRSLNQCRSKVELEREFLEFKINKDCPKHFFGQPSIVTFV